MQRKNLACLADTQLGACNCDDHVTEDKDRYLYAMLLKRKPQKTGIRGTRELQCNMCRYAIGECNYGGRVTDDKDRRLLATLLERVFRPEILSPDGCALSASGAYAVPAAVGDRAFYQVRIAELPPVAQVC